MALDLLVPDLLLPRAAPAEWRALRLPALERWLARADVAIAPARGNAAWLAAEFGLEAPLPIAPVARAGERAGAPGAWLRADPIHLRIDGAALVVHDASVLEVAQPEADALVAALQSVFAEDGLAFEAPAPDRWYVRVPQEELPVTVPLADALGRNAFGLLPQARGRIRWPSLMTEAQMVLAAHEVNAVREAEGRPQINSVWFWGEGTTPDAVRRPYASVHAASPFARGLARLSQAQARAVPARLADVDLTRGEESALVVLDQLGASLRLEAGNAWSEAARALDAQWFSALGEAIDRFGTVRVVLPRENDTLVARLNRAAKRRWLRRARALDSHA